MNIFPKIKIAQQLVLLCLCAGMAGTVFAAETSQNPLPPPADVKIEFDRDIRPILETSCWRCHGPQKPKSHFRLVNRASALAGGDNNTNDIVPGDSAKSRLIIYVARQMPDMEMPPIDKGDPLTPQQIGLLRAWIDQGLSWNTTNEPPSLNLTFAPTLRWIDVRGNQGQFRELQGTKAGFSEGVEKFSVTEQISPDEKFSLDGHAIVPEQDFDFKMALDKSDRGFIHAGFDQWRKYYNDTGGFDPGAVPPGFNSDRDLHVDNGRAWVDFGLDLPDWPQIVLGYEYQYKKGNESTLDWGLANGKNIYPATQSVDERTHILKLDATKNFDGWHLEDSARVEFYTEKNTGYETGILFGGTTPDEFITTRDNYRQVRGMNTLTLEKQIRDWWLLDGGFYYSQLSGSDYFNQTTAIPSLNFNGVLSSQQITLHRESEIFSVSSLFIPLNYLTLSLGTQNEWTRENGFSAGIPNLEQGGNVPANSSLDEFKASQSADLRFTRIPFTVVFGDARLNEENYSIYQAETPAEFQRETVADNFRYNLKPGFST
ncbi:MAG TPA: c-type cytochrome domain-containing protein, partial [Verrucomicrobiae bacterium]